jgi:hypothetical protein
VDAVDLAMLASDQPYEFERGRVYNLDGSRYIAEMESRGAGAHSDIAHPEVAHAMWSAVLLELQPGCTDGALEQVGRKL